MKSAFGHKPADLEDRLRAEKPLCETSADFAERVLADLSTRAARPAPAAVHAPLFGPRVAFAAGFACLFAVFLLRNQPPAPAAAPKPVALEQINLRLPQLKAADIEALTARFDAPLDKELKNVVSDTRQAIQFVAASFLPEN